jgi:hypothetical protein
MLTCISYPVNAYNIAAFKLPVVIINNSTAHNANGNRRVYVPFIPYSASPLLLSCVCSRRIYISI